MMRLIIANGSNYGNTRHHKFISIFAPMYTINQSKVLIQNTPHSYLPRKMPCYLEYFRSYGLSSASHKCSKQPIWKYVDCPFSICETLAQDKSGQNCFQKSILKLEPFSQKLVYEDSPWLELTYKVYMYTIVYTIPGKTEYRRYPRYKYRGK